MAGRPTKYTPQLLESVCDLLRQGNTRRVAASCSGISEDTFANYLRRYSDFSEAVVRAESEAEKRIVGVVQKAITDDNILAAQWWLERRRHQDYRKREGLELTGDPEAPVQVRIYIPKQDEEIDGSQGSP